MKTTTMKKYNYFTGIKILIAFAVVGLIIAAFASCNTVKKTTQSQKVNTDSVHVIKNETATVAKHDSVILKETKGDYTRETVIEFDTIPGNAFPFAVHDSSEVYNNYSVFKPKKITIRETGNYQTKDLGNYSNFDSSASKQIDSAMKHQTLEVKNTDKESSRMPIGLIIAGAVVLATIVVAVIYKPKINV